MSLLDSITGMFGGTDEGEDDEPETEERESTFAIWRVTLTYQDDSEDTFNCLRYVERDEGYKFYQDVRENHTELFEEPRTVNSEFIPYALLARPPESEKVGEVTVEYLWSDEYSARRACDGGVKEILSIEKDYEEDDD